MESVKENPTKGRPVDDQVAQKVTAGAVIVSTTPAGKRKAEVEVQRKKTESKKVRTTYTPRTQAKRCLRKSAAPTTSSEATRSTMQAMNKESAPIRMDDIRLL